MVASRKAEHPRPCLVSDTCQQRDRGQGLISLTVQPQTCKEAVWLLIFSVQYENLKRGLV